MRLNLKEFEKQLDIAKKLPAGEARTAMLDSLKAAEVFEADEKGAETRVNVKVLESDSPAAIVEKTVKVDEEAIKRLAADTATKAAADAIKAAQAEAPKPKVITQPEKKFTIPAEVRRVGSLKNFERREVSGYAADERAYRFGMWALAALGRENAKQFCRDQGIGLIATKAAHAEGTNTLGGLAVMA